MVTPLVLVGDWFANHGPLFFRQPRTGATARVPDPEVPHDAHGDPDVQPTNGPPRTMRGSHRSARVLRRTHLDELPQVVNILRGDLSVVGPRPEQPHYVSELTDKIPFYRLRHLVRPGLTGWAQVKFPYAGNEADTREAAVRVLLPPSSEPRARPPDRRTHRSECRRARGQVVRQPTVTVGDPDLQRGTPYRAARVRGRSDLWRDHRGDRRRRAIHGADQTLPRVQRSTVVDNPSADKRRTNVALESTW